MFDFKGFNSEQFYMICGLLSSFFSSGVRLMKDKSNFTSVYAVIRSIVDALTCALLSYGIFLILNSYWNVDVSVMIFLGTFVGSLGSSTIINISSSILKKHLGKNDNDVN